ncbi:peroxiredoxin AhpE [Gordonia araii NBRC 100433]|uniref:Alkyl hydroperoxide reductase E n=1 Tax=Gordonia araii NBRC 100433 TaxID=1073574 RepID=G7GZH5_9ACTN|nr:redoxin domain-containing protein [Gordonia araii]NNG97930.1 redoxin domain-containing protein [Gordonia araii NBRC 100433]GAB09000.1 peroxiredoxin AhpE [Gordonia araii NBRC 100433]
MQDLIAVGSRAPDFTLPDQNNQRVNLSTLTDERRTLLVFFPLAFTGNCEGELGLIRDRLPEFDNDSLTTVAISVGPPPTHKVWSSAQGFLFPILSDFWPHGAVAQQYGVFSERHGYSLRGTVLVDRDRSVLFSDAAEAGAPRDDSVWERALAAVQV